MDRKANNARMQLGLSFRARGAGLALNVVQTWQIVLL